MLIGYARVSTGEQDTAAQSAALKAAGCEVIFSEKASGGRWDRPELHKLLRELRKGDVLLVCKLDRLSRSLRDVLTIMERVQEKKAGFRRANRCRCGTAVRRSSGNRVPAIAQTARRLTQSLLL